VIGGQKAAVQVSQRNADSRILKDGSPPLLAFPQGLLSTLAIFDVDSDSKPSWNSCEREPNLEWLNGL
jgi:hypothetical protein